MLVTVLITVAVVLALLGVMAAVGSGRGKPRTVRSHGFHRDGHNPSTDPGFTSAGSPYRDFGAT